MSSTLGLCSLECIGFVGLDVPTALSRAARASAASLCGEGFTLTRKLKGVSGSLSTTWPVSIRHLSTQSSKAAHLWTWLLTAATASDTETTRTVVTPQSDRVY